MTDTPHRSLNVTEMLRETSRKTLRRLWRRPRRGDGTVVTFRCDRWAWRLNAVSHVLHIVCIVVLIWFLDEVGWGGLWGLVASGLTVGAVANARLHTVVDRTEPHIINATAAAASWWAKIAEWGARRCDNAERKLLAKAETASSDRAAERYRHRAERERRSAKKLRTDSLKY